MAMTSRTTVRFAADWLAALDAAKILGVRAGAEHRHTGAWVVVVEGRVFVRSWNDKPSGWHHALCAEPHRMSTTLELLPG